MKYILFSFVSIFSLSQAALAAESSPYVGTYKRTTPSASQMVVSHNNDKWSLEIDGAGIPNGASTAADCQIEAAGSLDNDILTAKLIEGDGGIFKVKFSKNHATVLEQDVSVCGMGSDLGGTYTKTR